MIVHTFLKQKWIQWNIGLTRQKYRIPNLNTTYEIQDQAVYQLSQDDLEYCTQTVRVHSQSTHRRADRVCEFGSRRLQSRRRPAGRRRCGHPMRLSMWPWPCNTRSPKMLLRALLWLGGGEETWGRWKHFQGESKEKRSGWQQTGKIKWVKKSSWKRSTHIKLLWRLYIKNVRTNLPGAPELKGSNLRHKRERNKQGAPIVRVVLTDSVKHTTGKKSLYTILQ